MIFGNHSLRPIGKFLEQVGSQPPPNSNRNPEALHHTLRRFQLVQLSSAFFGPLYVEHISRPIRRGISVPILEEMTERAIRMNG
jgi:hypothetical protein